MTFLEEIQKRLAEVQKRAQEVTTRLQVVQQEHQSVMQELASYQKIVQIETVRLQNERQQALSAPAAAPPAQPERPIVVEPPVIEEVNKTEAVRELLRQHPTGMTPAQLWQSMKAQVAHRQYIYSILKRLKDRKQITERRGKYFLLQPVSKPEEGGSLFVQ